MGDRSDTEFGDPDDDGPTAASFRPICPLLRRRKWPFRTAKRCEDDRLLEDLYAAACRIGDPAVLRTYLEEAAAVVRLNLDFDGPVTEEWAGVFLVHQSRFKALGRKRRISNVAGLDAARWRRNWTDVIRNARAMRARLQAPAPVQVPEPRPSASAVSVPTPSGRQRPPPERDEEASALEGLGAVLGDRVVLVVTGAHVSPGIVGWLERQLRPGQIRVVQGKDQNCSVASFRGSVRAIQQGTIHAVLVCFGHMSHGASGVFREAASSAEIPFATALRPTKRALLENVCELIRRLP